MTTIAIFLFVLLAILAVGQGLLVTGFWRTMRNGDRQNRDTRNRAAEWKGVDSFPKAAVILCLRGNDPFLADCLRAAFGMDYPKYDIHIIVDHVDDPAWKTVNAVAAEISVTNLKFHTLTQRRENCSLKCSSLIQVISDLDDSCAFVAQLDADTIPHRMWLRELATALDDLHVGAATGNRWYCPEDDGWGSLVRYCWNSAAIVQMHWYQIAWGGTLAIKSCVIRDARLLERWGTAFCEDTMLYPILKTRNLKLKLVPELLMINRESCSIAGFFPWVKRQLLTTRLYHPRWCLIVIHGISSTLLMTFGTIVFAIALFQQNSQAAAWAAGGVIGFQMANFLWLIIIENAARTVIVTRNGPATGFSSSQLIRMPIAVVLTQYVHFAALCCSMILRTVDWRRVSYRIDGPWKIRMQQYQPWPEVDDRTDSSSI